MDLKVSITRGGKVLSTERLASPKAGDVTKSLARQLDALKLDAGGALLEPYQMDVRDA